MKQATPGNRAIVMNEIADQVRGAGRRAHHSDWLDHVARAGLIAYGVVHVVLAWLAIQLAFGDREGSASSTGAVRELAQQPFGEVLVWAVCVGMALLVAWQLIEAVVGHRDEDGAHLVRKRVTSAGKAIIYATIGFSAFKVVTGSSGGGSGGSGGGKSGSTDSMTSQVMQLPGGQLYVGAVALGILTVAGYLIFKGVTDRFEDDLTNKGARGKDGTAFFWLGRIGYVAKGIAIGLVGALFLYAAVTHDPKKSGGLDVALRKLLEQPYGPVMLFAVGFGLGCYGLFSFARARHLSR